MSDGRIRVLVVEDEPDMNNLVAQVLTAYGYEPVQARSGEQALHILSERLPDAVLLDLMLPGLSGYEVCRRLKGNRATNLIPVLMLTALDRAVDRRHGYETGADDYVTKPFSPQGLVSRLEACVASCREAKASSDRLVLRFELSAAPASLKGVNVLTSALYHRTPLPPEPIETLRTCLLRLANAAEEWAIAHGGAPPAEVEIEFDPHRLSLVFRAATPKGSEFLGLHLAADAPVPAELAAAGIVDRAPSSDGAVVFEKAL
jgi:CheY-like chemotaxis protein